MKKRIVSLIIALLMTFVGVSSMEMIVLAEETDSAAEDIDFSYFTDVNSLVGYMDMQTRGVYLASGNSYISKISSYQIGASGITNAAIKCEVSVSVIVEKYNLERDSWGFVTSWKQTNANAFTAAISKSLIVDSGYFYRVRCLHSASSDSSSSYTNALYVGN